jgi:hypothetical protein
MPKASSAFQKEEEKDKNEKKQKMQGANMKAKKEKKHQKEEKDKNEKKQKMQGANMQAKKEKKQEKKQQKRQTLVRSRRRSGRSREEAAEAAEAEAAIGEGRFGKNRVTFSQCPMSLGDLGCSKCNGGTFPSRSGCTTCRRKLGWVPADATKKHWVPAGLIADDDKHW